jgi:hypothetical protein
MKFQVGDQVSWCGAKGVVVDIEEDMTYPVVVMFLGGSRRFTASGKYLDWHKTRSLKLVDRPKKKVKKTVERWMSISSDQVPCFYLTQQIAEENTSPGRIACVRLTGEYEVEE